MYTNVKLQNQKRPSLLKNNGMKFLHRKADLDKNMLSHYREIESYRADNAVLDSLFETKKQELDAKKAKIDALLVRFHLWKPVMLPKLNCYGCTIVDWCAMESAKACLQASIDSPLSTRHCGEDKEKISVNWVHAKQKKQETDEENQKWKMNRQGFHLGTANIQSTPIRMTRKGKEDEVSKAKDAEKLRVCFDLIQNKIAPHPDKHRLKWESFLDGTTIQDAEPGEVGTLKEATTGRFRYPHHLSWLSEWDSKRFAPYGVKPSKVLLPKIPRGSVWKRVSDRQSSLSRNNLSEMKHTGSLQRLPFS